MNSLTSTLLLHAIFVLIAPVRSINHYVDDSIVDDYFGYDEIKPTAEDDRQLQLVMMPSSSNGDVPAHWYNQQFPSSSLPWKADAHSQMEHDHQPHQQLSSVSGINRFRRARTDNHQQHEQLQQQQPQQQEQEQQTAEVAPPAHAEYDSSDASVNYFDRVRRRKHRICGDMIVKTLHTRCKGCFKPLDAEIVKMDKKNGARSKRGESITEVCCIKGKCTDEVLQGYCCS